jgi:uncharacterized protein (TIGR03437 family)
MYAAQAQALSPLCFVFDGTYVVATHADAADIGPATLYPGLTTPASPGETIVIYGNGYGQTPHQWSADRSRNPGPCRPSP